MSFKKIWLTSCGYNMYKLLANDTYSTLLIHCIINEVREIKMQGMMQRAALECLTFAFKWILRGNWKKEYSIFCLYYFLFELALRFESIWGVLDVHITSLLGYLLCYDLISHSGLFGNERHKEKECLKNIINISCL